MPSHPNKHKTSHNTKIIDTKKVKSAKGTGLDKAFQRLKAAEHVMESQSSVNPSKKLAGSISSKKLKKKLAEESKQRGKDLLNKSKKAGKAVRAQAVKKSAGRMLRILGRLSVGAEAAGDATSKFMKNVKRKRKAFRSDEEA